MESVAYQGIFRIKAVLQVVSIVRPSLNAGFIILPMINLFVTKHERLLYQEREISRRLMCFN